MNLKELKELIDIVASRDSIEELEIERAGVKLRIKRSSGMGHASAPSHTLSAGVVPALSVPSSTSREPESENLLYVTSPIVGTFYKGPSPTADAFVSVGDTVEKGAVLCIIEAMKLMNEIESEIAGEIAAVLVEDRQPVEFGEKLFAIRPR